MIKKITSIFVATAMFAACSKEDLARSSGLVTPLPTGLAAVATTITGNNVIPLEVDTLGYLNEPVVSVRICKPGTSTCTTINRILLDTGSSGLRVFGSLVSSLSLDTVTKSVGVDIAKCTTYADGTAQWGPVKTADLILGGETVSSVNIQVIDSAYASVPSACSGAENDPVAAGYNGIMGVGVRDHDCGSTCVSLSSNQSYFACTGTSCSASIATLAQQVRNPVGAMTSASNSDGIDDSNGSALVLPAVPSTGAVTASGYLVFGVGTRSNNKPTTSVKVFATNSSGFMMTVYAGSTLTSFIDSGSNGLFFPTTTQNPTCSGGWFCPTSTLTLSATQRPYSGSAVTNAVSFEVVNAQQVFVSSNYAYSNLGASLPGNFDWGLPFFFGRTVYTGITGKTVTYTPSGGSSTTLSGTYYAY